MTREEFMQNIWNYYLILEEDFLKVERFIEIEEDNFNTYSKEFVKQFQAICSELDVMFKMFCGYKLTEGNKSMFDYSKYMKENYPEISNKKAVLIQNGIEIQPFQNWKHDSKEKTLEWWTSYNKVKHNRFEKEKLANLKNVLYSLAGLFLIEKFYYLRKVKHDGVVVFDKESKIFKISGWRTTQHMFPDGLIVDFGA